MAVCDVSILIVEYHTGQILLDCIDSIYRHTHKNTFEIIVCDNGADEYEKELITKKYPEVCYILSENKGFGAGNNLAAQHAKGKYLFLLNPDTILLNDAIADFFTYYESTVQNGVKLGCIGGWLLDRNMHLNGSYYKFPPQLPFLYAMNLRNLFRKNFHTVAPAGDDIVPLYDKKVDYVIGADLFISSSLFKHLGGFDEQIFMYSEEAELQYRIKKLGLERRIIRGPRIIHLEGQSQHNKEQKVSNQKRVWQLWGKLYFYKKHFPHFFSMYKQTLFHFSKKNVSENNLYSDAENNLFFAVFDEF